MKRYSVKKIIRMEDKRRRLYLDQLDVEFDELLPFAGLAGVGAGLTAMSIPTGDILLLLVTSLASLYGGSVLAYFATAEARSDKLMKKLDEIYDVMGEDFKKEVEKKRLEQGNKKSGRSM